MAASTKPSARPTAPRPKHQTSEGPQATAQSAASSAMLSGFAGIRRVPAPVNEPVRSYAPGSPERAELKARLDAMAGERVDIPIIIGGKEIRSGKTSEAVMP